MRTHAQSKPEAQNPPDVPQPSGRSIEDLNYVGGDTVMPPFSESLIDMRSRYRQALLSKGIALRVISSEVYNQNVLNRPVPADDQTYVGQRPFESAMVQPILTADLRQLHLQHAQFYLAGVWNWSSWNPANPKALQLWDLYIYKEFGKDRVELKAGYVSNNLDFVGLFVGGSTATAAQGVYAVLPYELGMSYFPLTSPSANIRMRGPQHTYLKTGFQRSLDPSGGTAEVARNHTGFRFDPHGDGLLLIEEAGFQRAAAASAPEVWIRGGYAYNSTAFTSLVNDKQQTGNHLAFALADLQIHQPNPVQPAQGLYLGGTAMTAAASLNAYDRYYEARLYQKAPFRSRPADMASLVASYTGHSRYFTESLVAAGKTVWRNSASVTGSYSLRVHSGQYMSIGLSYIHGPAITPRVDDALTFAASYTVFF
ncbi:MAG TPA: carbohydrate porin [Terracidiphilus sp.]|nr:carbohydrate porin [Terracidiphilus sp.]